MVEIMQNQIFEQKRNYLDFCQDILKKEKLFLIDYELIYKIWVLYDLYSISSGSIKKIIKISLDNEINSSLDEVCIKRLLQTAFIFANLNSDEYVNNLEWDKKEKKIEEIDKMRNYSYRIAISIYYYWKYLKEEIRGNRIELDSWFFDNNIIIYRLFTRLWILSKSRNDKLEDVDIFSMDLQWKIESTNKESLNRFCIEDMFENTVLREKFWDNFLWFKNDEIFFSDFQNGVVDSLLWYDNYWWTKTWKSIAISAPTSAWKTFILKKYIIYKIIEKYLSWENINIVFIVPSKALINELKQDFIELFDNYNLNSKEWKKDTCSIHTHLSWDDFIKNFKEQSNLFIFTQERLNFFYSSIDSKFLKIDLVVVDEAHKVWYWYRGTLLSYIVWKIKKENKNIQIVLLAPLLSKLLKFKKEFWLDQLEEKFSNFWLVAKNEIFVKKEQLADRGRYFLEFLINIWDKKNILLFIIKENFWNSQPKYITYLAKKFSVGTQAILFRVFPWKTKEQAESLFKETEEVVNLELDYLSIYIDDILPSMDLSKYIKNWIAYHNGILPVSIKWEIERLFKLEKIKYLCANSTVLEWVNLPAKNIFIWNDWGNDYINNSDFKNLIWRAWRLNNHLSWNIFYIDSSTYEEKLPDENNITEDFSNNISNTIDDTDKSIIWWLTKFDRFLEYIRSDNWCFKVIVYQNEEEKIFLWSELKDFEYMTGYLLSKYIDNKAGFVWNIWTFIYTKWEEKINKLQDLEKYINTIYKDIILYSWNKEDDALLKIIIKNIFIDPRKQLRFYVNVLEWNNNFIIENIDIFSDILKVFNNTEVLDIELKKYWENEFEKKITEKSKRLESIFWDVQENFIREYQLYSSKKDKLYEKYFSWNGIFDNEQKVLHIFNSWICSYWLKDILTKDNFNEKLKIISNEIQFNYLNAFSIYFELANLWYKRYLEESNPDLYDIYLNENNFPQLDTNFIYYMELWTFYPNLLYLISKGVSRESAIWLKDNKLIHFFPYNGVEEKDYFIKEKDNILHKLSEMNKVIIKEELKRFIY